MRETGLSTGSLHMWAKEDSPYEYKTLIQRVNQDIIDCNGSHNAVAAIAYKLFQGKYVCAAPDGRIWYTFNGSLWKEDNGGINIRHELSTTMEKL